MLEKVKIGGMTYEVVLKDLKTRNDDYQGMQLGWHILPDNLIEINSEVCKERREQTLVHEIMHGVMNEAGLNLEDEEDIVNRISLVLYQVLKDNDFSFLKS